MSVEIMIFHQGVPVVKTTTRNLSLGGMLIESGAAHFNRNDIVEVELVEDAPLRQRFPAMVVRRHGIDSLGLMFWNEETGIRKVLADSGMNDLDYSGLREPVFRQAV